jgi:hypothetical protein
VFGALVQAAAGNPHSVAANTACRDASRVNDEWFSDTDGIRAAVGLIDAQARPTQGEGKVRRPVQQLWSPYPCTAPSSYAGLPQKNSFHGDHP